MPNSFRSADSGAHRALTPELLSVVPTGTYSLKHTLWV